jgi:cytochrome-b5 reductase
MWWRSSAVGRALGRRWGVAAAAAGCGAAAASAASASHCLEGYGSNERWYREWLEQQLADHPPAMSKDKWTPLKLWSVIQQSPNTKLLRFVFDDPHAAAGMDVASYLLTRAFIGKEKEDGSRGVVVRPYTPSHTTIGYLELVVKGYPEGKMSKHMHSLKPGDTLDFKGPMLGTPIIQNEFEEIGLIAGGSGITPMLQVAQRALANPAQP